MRETEKIWPLGDLLYAKVGALDLIEIRVEDPSSPPVIYMTRDTIAALVNFARLHGLLVETGDW